MSIHLFSNTWTLHSICINCGETSECLVHVHLSGNGHEKVFWLFACSRRSRGCKTSWRRRIKSWRPSGKGLTRRKKGRSSDCAPPCPKVIGHRPPGPSFATLSLKKPSSWGHSLEPPYRCARSFWGGWRKRKARQPWRIRELKQMRCVGETIGILQHLDHL